MNTGKRIIKYIVFLMFALYICNITACMQGEDFSGNDVSDTASDSDADNIDTDTGSPLDIELEKDSDVLIVDMIDDMEKGSGRILERNGRNGVWHVYNDQEVNQWPPVTDAGVPVLTELIAGGRGESTRAMHTICKRNPYLDGPEGPWGAGIGFDLVYDDGNQDNAYDASTYRGITFWGRSFENVDVPLLLGSVEDVAEEWGGKCSSYEYEPGHMETLVPFTTEWKKFWVFFSSSWVPEAALSELLNVQFFFRDDFFEAVDYAFDFWIDDIAFFKGRPECYLPNAVCLFEPQPIKEPPLI